MSKKHYCFLHFFRERVINSYQKTKPTKSQEKEISSFRFVRSFPLIKIMISYNYKKYFLKKEYHNFLKIGRKIIKI